MFVDEVLITVKGGKGGNGAVSFRREKYIPFGGPDGGNGGQGGDVILLSENNLDTLSHFRGKKVFAAADGIKGQGKKLAGKGAEPLILKVPAGTLVTDAKTKEILHDFITPHEQYIVAAGGRGGYGNAHFVSSTRQAPKFAELGDEGEVKNIILTLKLIADVGIVGLPNAGKSTLISHISAARPKIADYPFTTLIPNLGIVDHKGKSFVVADTPGLIPGASKGKGLGIRFLQHIERTGVLLHLVDARGEDPVKAYTSIAGELKKYKHELEHKPQIVALNKTDLLLSEELDILLRKFAKKKIQPVLLSAATGMGVSQLLDQLISLLSEKATPVPVAEKAGADFRIFRPHLEDPKYFAVEKKRGFFVIRGKRIEQIVRMSPPGNPEALERIYDVFMKMGISRELLRQGARDGTPVMIGKTRILFRDMF